MRLFWGLLLAAAMPLPLCAQAVNQDLEPDFDPGGHTGRIWKVLFTPDGKYLISVADDATIRQWNVSTGEVRAYKIPGRRANRRLFSAALSTDGELLAVSGYTTDGFYDQLICKIFVISLNSNKKTFVTLSSGHINTVTALAFLPKKENGSYVLVSGSLDSTIRVWQLNTQQSRIYFSTGNGVTSLAIDPTGTLLASGSEDGTIRVITLNPSVGLLKGSGKFENNIRVSFSVGTAVTGIAWSPNGKMIVAVGRDRKIRFCKELTTIETIEVLGTNIAWSSVTFSPDSGRLMVTGDGCFVIDLVKNKEQFRFLGHTSWVTTGAISPDGELMASGGILGDELFLWKPLATFSARQLAGYGGVIKTVAWAKDGQSLQWKSNERPPSIIPLALGEAGSLALGTMIKAKQPGMHLVDLDVMTTTLDVQGAIVTSKNNDSLGASGSKLIVRTSKGARLEKEATSSIACQSWIDEQHAIIGTWGSALSPEGKVFDILSKNWTGNLVGHQGPIQAVVPSPDARFVATGSADRTVRLWFWKSGSFYDHNVEPLLTLFPAGQDWVVWLPNGRYACSPGGQKFFGAWIQPTINELAEFRSAATIASLKNCSNEIKLMLKLLLSPPSEAYILRFIERDLHLNRDSKNISLFRYFSFSHYWLAGRIGASQAKRNLQELSFLLNSLSWGSELAIPEAIDPSETLFRINLGNYKSPKGAWDKRWWDRILAEYPYAWTPHYRESVKSTASLEGGQLSYVRGDWFCFAAARAPLYYDLLNLPRTEKGVEKHLLLDTCTNVRLGHATRVAVTKSGISPNNRLIERHDISLSHPLYAAWATRKEASTIGSAVGQAGSLQNIWQPGWMAETMIRERTDHPAYWKTYDFNNNIGRRNLFSYPLGPEAQTDSFLYDGSELLFHLPNGLLAFAAFDQLGGRWDASPIESSGKHSHVAMAGNPTAPVASRCITGCHSQGIERGTDDLLQHILEKPNVFSPKISSQILRLHLPQLKINQLFDNDTKRFIQTRQRAWLGSDLVNDTQAPVYMMTYPLNAESAAAELFLSPDTFQQHLIDSSPELLRVLGVLRSNNGTLQREAFSTFFCSIVTEWGLGRPASPSTFLPQSTGGPVLSYSFARSFYWLILLTLIICLYWLVSRQRSHG